MKRYNITVNGKVYDVAVEEVNGAAPAPVATAPAASVSPAAPAPVAEAAPAPAPVAEAAPAPAPAAHVAGRNRSNISLCPELFLISKLMLAILLKLVSPVIVLEAMKMENDINTPVAGNNCKYKYH